MSQEYRELVKIVEAKQKQVTNLQERKDISGVYYRSQQRRDEIKFMLKQYSDELESFGKVADVGTVNLSSIAQRYQRNGICKFRPDVKYQHNLDQRLQKVPKPMNVIFEQ